jgi:hypothetical protein
MNLRWHLCVLLVAAGCGSTGPSASMQIGPSGGQVSAGDAAAVSIPAGALTSSINITVSTSSAAAPTDTVAVGSPYLFGPEGTQFATPVAITLAFSSSLLPAGKTTSDVVIYTASAGSTDYQELATTLVDASHVQASTTHFSIFVAAVGLAPDAGMNEGPDAGTDAGVPGDDLANAPDLSSVADAGPCVPAFSGTVQPPNCSFTATCNGHTYKIQCVSASCTCIVDNVMGQSVNNAGTTCFGTTGAPAWGFCGFP